MKTKIPIYNQRAEAIGGIFIFQPTANIEEQISNIGVHRDDFFNFFVLTKGSALMKCDMIDIEIYAPGILMVMPFQVHSPQNITKDAKGYYISAAPFLIPSSCFEIFQNLKINQQAHQITAGQQQEIFDTVALLQLSFEKNNPEKTQIINSIFNALVHHFANSYQSAISLINEPKNQSWQISVQFKKLITKYSFLESPSFFAKKLNISTSHLNDCVNASTGKSVTYWLQNAMIVAAQRLLYYTDNDVKEIAFELGFGDHTYFSRLFKKIISETPLTFRRKFRE